MMSKEAKRAIIAEGSFIEWQDSAGTLEKVKLIHRLDVRSEKQIHRQLLAYLERVERQDANFVAGCRSRGRAP